MLGLSLLVQEGAMPTSSLMRAADTEQSKEDVRAAAAATPDDETPLLDTLVADPPEDSTTVLFAPGSGVPKPGGQSVATQPSKVHHFQEPLKKAPVVVGANLPEPEMSPPGDATSSAEQAAPVIPHQTLAEQATPATMPDQTPAAQEPPVPEQKPAKPQKAQKNKPDGSLLPT